MLFFTNYSYAEMYPLFNAEKEDFEKYGQSFKPSLKSMDECKKEVDSVRALKIKINPKSHGIMIGSLTVGGAALGKAIWNGRKYLQIQEQIKQLDKSLNSSVAHESKDGLRFVKNLQDVEKAGLKNIETNLDKLKETLKKVTILLKDHPNAEILIPFYENAMKSVDSLIKNLNSATSTEQKTALMNKLMKTMNSLEHFFNGNISSFEKNLEYAKGQLKVLSPALKVAGIGTERAFDILCASAAGVLMDFLFGLTPESTGLGYDEMPLAEDSFLLNDSYPSQDICIQALGRPENKTTFLERIGLIKYSVEKWVKQTEKQQNQTSDKAQPERATR
ncbi:MAG: hypothetical protein ACXVC3_18870 [Bdellovibrio sp.]